MSYDCMLVKAEDAQAKAALGEDFTVLPMGSATEVKVAIADLFPELEWDLEMLTGQSGEALAVWTSMSEEPAFQFSENEEGQVNALLLAAADRESAVRIADALGLTLFDADSLAAWGG